MSFSLIGELNMALRTPTIEQISRQNYYEMTIRLVIQREEDKDYDNEVHKEDESPLFIQLRQSIPWNLSSRVIFQSAISIFNF